MIIYGEYLFIENFIVGLLLLLLTGKLMGNRTILWRILAASILCGLSGFLVFTAIHPLVDGITRLVTLFTVVYVAFGRSYLLKTAAIFMVLTFLSGGAVMALLLWQQEPAITHQGIVYIDIITYFRLLCFGTLAFGFTYWFIRFLRGARAQLSIKGKVCLIIEGTNYYFTAFVDSGNSLREPSTGKPVVLLDKKGADKLPFQAREVPARYVIIPYKTVGLNHGFLEGLRTDTVIFEEKKVDGACVAFYDGEFDRYEVLLNRDFLEGGLLKNA